MVLEALAINRAVNAMRTVIILICTEAINLSQSKYNSEYKLQLTIDGGIFDIKLFHNFNLQLQPFFKV